MRCMNCGWDNLSDTTVCLKCGQLLSISTGYANNQNDFVSREGYGEAIPKPTVLNANPNREKCRKTVVFPTLNEPDTHSAITQPATECPNCSYPIVGEFTSCPCCGTPLERADNSADDEHKKMEEKTSFLPEDKMNCQECGKEIDITCSFCPHCGVRVHRPTIRRQIKNIAETEPEDITPHCSLTMIPEENENIPSEKMEYEGKSIILNRENTEVSNRTITSKEQAEIVFEDGHWYLLDRSELRTTFIQANRKIEIIPDDIIVLGDRRFKFESDLL